MAQANVPQQPTALNLPLLGGKQAPSKFSGDYDEVERFLENYEQLLAYHQITTDQDKCRAITRYVSRKVREVIEALDSYRTPNWATLKSDLEKLYDADRYKTRYKKKDLVAYVHKTRKRKMNDLRRWRKYNRDFVRIAGWLRGYRRSQPMKRARIIG